MLKVSVFCSHFPAGITDWLGLEGTLKLPQSQPPARDRDGSTRSAPAHPGGSHSHLTPAPRGAPEGHREPPWFASTELAELRWLRQETQAQSRAGDQTARAEEGWALLWAGDALPGLPRHI